jgi:hypothetical protein
MFNAWPEIELLYQVRRTLKHLREVSAEDPSVPTPPSAVTYRPKVKLDGTNAAVRIEANGDIFAQSRTTDLTPQKDSMGFARWLFSTPGLVEEFKGEVFCSSFQTTIYGEWCGKGIQKGTAISTVEKTFAVFAVQQDATVEGVVHSNVIVEPQDIKTILADLMAKFPMVKAIDWYGADTLTIPYDDQERLIEIAKVMDQMVLDVEACDPWVKANFGVEGVGEGIVFYPISEEKGLLRVIPRDRLDLLIFKAKGEKHRVKESKAAVQIDPEVFASIQAFVASFVTQARCEQGITVACEGQAEMPKMGGFLKWIVADVEKESGTDLEASKLTFKQVSGAIQKAAREWFMGKVRGEV